VLRALFAIGLELVRWTLQQYLMKFGPLTWSWEY
jgi:hypothetical protein